MTDQPPTDYPGDVWATGQRRQPDGSFPSGGGGAGTGVGGINQNDLDPADPGTPTDPEAQADPCADPETALEWNADAAAAEAAKEFARLAADQTPPEDLNTREWGAYLSRPTKAPQVIYPTIRLTFTIKQMSDPGGTALRRARR